RRVPTPRHDGVSVWAEQDAGDFAAVGGEAGHGLTGGDLPQPYRLVGAAAGQEATVGRKSERVDVADVAFQLANAVATVSVPQGYALVIPRGCQQQSGSGRGDRTRFGREHWFDGGRRVGGHRNRGV